MPAGAARAQLCERVVTRRDAGSPKRSNNSKVRAVRDGEACAHGVKGVNACVRMLVLCV